MHPFEIESDETETRSKLTRSWLDVCMRAGVEPPVEKFNSDPIVNLWFLDRFCILNCGPHNYKRK